MQARANFGCTQLTGLMNFSLQRSRGTAHRHLRITPSEWEAFMDDLAQTLDKFAVPAAERAAWPSSRAHGLTSLSKGAAERA